VQNLLRAKYCPIARPSTVIMTCRAPSAKQYVKLSDANDVYPVPRECSGGVSRGYAASQAPVGQHNFFFPFRVRVKAMRITWITSIVMPELENYFKTFMAAIKVWLGVENYTNA
jgi:hypothetical protein